MNRESRTSQSKLDSIKSLGFWTPANIVTSIRVVLIPLWMCLAWFASSHQWQIGLLLVALFYSALSLTDSLDGYLARSRNEVTTFGKFLDPIADKLIVVAACIHLMNIDVLPGWMLMVILTREFLISGLRMLVANSGIVVAASIWGKLKTATTMIALILLMLGTAKLLPFADALEFIGALLMWIAIGLTIWSGYDYLRACWPSLVSNQG